jgi:simple sugar transport system permease protein
MFAFMRLSIEPRAAAAPVLEVLIPPMAVLATIAASGLLFGLLGYPIGRTLYAFFVAPLTSLNGWAEMALKAGPLAMIAAGLALGFRSGVWNIGAQGQLTMGAVAGGGVALALPNATGIWVMPLVCTAGLLGGMAWGAIPALLRTRLGANEILTSLMLTYIASLILSSLVFGPWKDPDGYSLPQSPMFSNAATLSPIVPHSRLTIGTLLEFLVPVALWVLMRHALIGFKIRTAGAAPAAAAYAGFGEERLVWLVFLIGSGLAGLAGIFEAAGPIGQLVQQITPGYGFTAIIVAFLGRLNPLGIIPAALLVALSYIGGDTAQVSVGLPNAAAGVVQGLLLFFPLAANFLTGHRVRLA